MCLSFRLCAIVAGFVQAMRYRRRFRSGYALSSQVSFWLCAIVAGFGLAMRYRRRFRSGYVLSSQVQIQPCDSSFKMFLLVSARAPSLFNLSKLMIESLIITTHSQRNRRRNSFATLSFTARADHQALSTVPRVHSMKIITTHSHASTKLTVIQI